MIIDSHRHLAKEGGEDFPEAKEKFLADLKLFNISKAIVIADNQAKSDTADTRKLIDIFTEHSKIRIVGAIYPFSNLKEQEIYFDKLLSEKSIIGLKMFNGFDKLYPTDKECSISYNLAQKYNVPVIFHTGINIDDEKSAQYNDPKYIVEVAKKYPNLKVIISHFYWPKIEYCLDITKNIDNIYLDTTVLADKDAIDLMGKSKIIKVLEAAIGLKPNNIIFGSDYPACNTKEAIDLVYSLNISNLQKENILYKNSGDLFNL